ncbi:MAG: hypothetical protein JSW44_02890 [Candidatus Bathyarchaeota archaeon]|nr:MAG: hypothetical protein JSW44_02890 [Candidatus Bathyarchaeota archaeon]
MRRKRKKSHIESKPRTIDVDNLVMDTTRKESFQVFEVLASMRKYIIVLLMFSGALSTFFSVQFLMGIQIFSSALSPIALAAMAILGVVNIICGLLLLASE